MISKLINHSKLAKLFSSRNYVTGFVKDSKFPITVEKPKIVPKVTTIGNGVRVVTYNNGYPACTVGLFLDAGSVHETEQTNGTAHFLEHMAFKGTEKHDAAQLESIMENMGSKLYAYTSREHTAFSARCFSKDGGKLVEVLSDIIQKPLLKEDAIKREIDVILRESEDIESKHDEVVFDYLHSTAYQGSSLSYTILGPSNNIINMSRENLSNYIKTNYTGPRTILIAVGDVDHEEYVDHANKFLGTLSPEFYNCTDKFEAPKPACYIGSEARIRIDEMPLAHVALAFEGCSSSDPDFFPLMLATLYLGSYSQSMALGKAYTSGLARRVADKQLCHSFNSFNASYYDTGLWGIYFVTDRLLLAEMLIAIGIEWNSMSSSITDFQTEVAKNLFKSQYLMNMDTSSSIFEEIGRQMLAYNRYYTPLEVFSKVDAVTAEDMRNALLKIFTKTDHVITSMGPVDQLPNYIATRGFLMSSVLL